MKINPANKKYCIIIQSSPYYNSRGEEGLDFILAASAMSNNLSVIFIDDGVWQLHTDQKPEKINHKRYTAGFAALPSFDINNVYIDEESIKLRNINIQDLLLNITLLKTTQIKQLLQHQDGIFHF